MKKYREFDYSLPPKPAEYYANMAIEILTVLKRDFPAFYKHSFRCPSEVLTLSGVRAFDTYYSFGKKATDKELAALRKFLVKHKILVIEEDLAIAGELNTDHHYSLVNLSAINDIPNRYKAAPGWFKFSVKLMKSDNDFVRWWDMWTRRVGFMDGSDSELPLSIWRRSWWAPHNITFGMLLGYPGEAIASVLYDDVSRIHRNTEARILHAYAFDGAVPIYDYKKSLRKNANIVAHEKLWSDILDLVYKAMGENTTELS